MADPEYEYDDRDEGVTCPRCVGDGSVSCHCGGDTMAQAKREAIRGACL